MKTVSITLTICLFSLLFNSCNPCRNDDCPFLSANICFDLVDETGASLVFDNEAYELDSIITQSNQLINPAYSNAFHKSLNGRDCIALHTDVTTRYFVALNNNDIDTIDLSYKTRVSECCKNTFVETVEDYSLTYNSKLICASCMDTPKINVMK